MTWHWAVDAHTLHASLGDAGDLIVSRIASGVPFLTQIATMKSAEPRQLDNNGEAHACTRNISSEWSRDLSSTLTQT